MGNISKRANSKFMEFFMNQLSNTNTLLLASIYLNIRIVLGFHLLDLAIIKKSKVFIADQSMLQASMKKMG